MGGILSTPNYDVSRIIKLLENANDEELMDHFNTEMLNAPLNEDEQTILMLAIANHNEQLYMKLLNLQKRIDFTVTDVNGYNVFWYAVKYNETVFIVNMLKEKAYRNYILNLCDNDDNIVTMCQNNIDLMNLIITTFKEYDDNGDKLYRFITSGTPNCNILTLAVEGDRFDIFSELLGIFKMKLTHEFDDGSNLLMKIFEYNRIEFLDKLIEYDDSLIQNMLYNTDNDGDNILDYAFNNNCKEILDYFANTMANSSLNINELFNNFENMYKWTDLDMIDFVINIMESQDNPHFNMKLLMTFQDAFDNMDIPIEIQMIYYYRLNKMIKNSPHNNEYYTMLDMIMTESKNIKFIKILEIIKNFDIKSVSMTTLLKNAMQTKEVIKESDSDISEIDSE